MGIDQTTQLAPILWGMIALLLVLAGAILASLDPEVTEVYLGDPRLLLASGALAVTLLIAIVATRPGIAHGLGIPWPH